METEVGIAVFVVVYVRKFIRAFRAGLSTPHQVSPESVDPALTSLTTTVFPSAARALAQKNNVRLIDGNELARLETAMQASGGETSVDQ